MVSAGRCHTVLLQSDGSAVACGTNTFGQCNIPALEEGLSYTQASAGRAHTVLLRSDGRAVACGSNSEGQCNIPPLEEGMSYTQVSAGECHTVLLRSDGRAVAVGENRWEFGFGSFGQYHIPDPEAGSSYVDVSAGPHYTMLLISNGRVTAPGDSDLERLSLTPCLLQELHAALNISSPRNRMSCKAISAGGHHMVILHSNGKAEAFAVGGFDDHGQCQFPALEDGVSYTQVSAGGLHTLLLRSDGQVVACGSNRCGQCKIPPLDEGSGLSYTEVSAGDYHSVLLRSDGLVVTCGDNSHGQCDVPPPTPGKTYVCDARLSGDIIVEVHEDFDSWTLLRTSGQVFVHLPKPGAIGILPARN